jgi:cytoskeletal protein CcmA (bactofilin family)
VVGFSKEPAGVATGEPKQAATLTVIGRESKVVGEITGSRGVRIEGTVAGKIHLKAPVEVAEGAVVEAEIHATAVRVSGSVSGNITASEVVELLAPAKVTGDITTPALRVVEGAKLEGRVQMKSEPVHKAGPASPDKSPAKA